MVEKDTKQLLDEWYFNHGDWVDHSKPVEGPVWNGSDTWNWWDDAGKIHETRRTANSYDYPGTFVDPNVCPHCGEVVICSLRKE